MIYVFFYYFMVYFYIKIFTTGAENIVIFEDVYKILLDQSVFME